MLWCWIFVLQWSPVFVQPFQPEDGSAVRLVRLTEIARVFVNAVRIVVVRWLVKNQKLRWSDLIIRNHTSNPIHTVFTWAERKFEKKLKKNKIKREQKIDPIFRCTKTRVLLLTFIHLSVFCFNVGNVYNPSHYQFLVHGECHNEVIATPYHTHTY